jgi:hypothetical protein
MEDLAADRHILDWDETDVHNWLSSLGYSQYETQIRGIVSRFSGGNGFFLKTPQNTRSEGTRYAT